MIRTYLWERKSWILFFIVSHLILIFIAYIDTAIPLQPILYMVFVSLLFFIVFVFIRYQKETRFFKRLKEWDHNLNITGVDAPDTPFEEIISESLSEQANLLRKAASENRMVLEQEKDELLSWIHEVKTPLTAMHLMIERLENEPLKAPIKYEWLRIHLLLDQQLHQKRMAFMENDLYIENTDLESLIFQEIKTLQSWCIQKGIGFDIQLDVTEVLSDAKWLAFMIRQLLTNAVKYSTSSDIMIKSEEHGGKAVLTIQDFGRGIDPKDLPRIFDKGFTSTIHHNDHSSTGMGLYLTKKVSESLLISIEVKSHQGEGTRVTLTFPQKNDFVQLTGV
ncbi:sensor histidine kinase [Rossellomorea aquimaris]|uniref:histidine kinase n=1 Tax=Rossellomorea aquimaris TaxID=189382 RepID=A0A366ETV3_9BACI|nr:sensor histidine kinase [Rossellomorea aquimaris]RBP04929.1 OmpR family two-component system bacitracin resistance sensor histidine kinase BceS [Rossellomorea aquimaris]